MRQVVQQEYYTTSDIATILGCSRRQAYNIAITLPHVRTMNKRGAAIRVKIEILEKYLKDITIMPEQFQPRCTPFNTEKDIIAAWHERKQKGEARP